MKKSIYPYTKRIIDFVVSIFGVIVFFPLFLIITIILFFLNKGTPFYFQQRVGLKGKIFTIYKFKTMNDEQDAQGNLLPYVDRLTKFGRFLRTTSLDEIPQFINVLKGDMSLIGPRPLLIKYLPFYSKEQSRRHEVLPGITGWAQINGRNDISWTRKFELDVWYVDHLSFKLDMKIFFLTIKKILVKEGISKEGMAITDFFDGTN